ncbi:hypothetical protein MY4824_006407 [Beauveria thailandica]
MTAHSSIAPLSVDLLVKVLNGTIFHPFAAAMILLCLLALAMLWSALLAFAWATFVSLLYVASAVNQRIAHGIPRQVNLDEEVIVITGGASGLGLLVAKIYGMRGVTVAVLDINDMQDPENYGVSFYKCDISDYEQVKAIALKIEEELGTPTVLINNAAIVVGKLLLDLSVDDIQRTISTNLLGPFYCLKAFLPAIIRSGSGTIMNISSVIGHLGAAHLSDYAAAKAGLSAMHRSVSAELRESHPEIKTVLITPGQLGTALFHGVQTPSNFVAPIVELPEVAMEVVDAIDRGNGAMMGMPLYARWVDWYSVLPASVQVLARKLLGVDRAMRTFIGKNATTKSRD